MEVLYLLFVNLSLLQHALLESQSFLDQPVVLLLGELSLFGPECGLVLLPQLHLVTLLEAAQLFLLHLNRCNYYFFCAAYLLAFEVLSVAEGLVDELAALAL